MLDLFFNKFENIIYSLIDVIKGFFNKNLRIQKYFGFKWDISRNIGGYGNIYYFLKGKSFNISTLIYNSKLYYQKPAIITEYFRIKNYVELKPFKKLYFEILNFNKLKRFFSPIPISNNYNYIEFIIINLRSREIYIFYHYYLPEKHQNLGLEVYKPVEKPKNLGLDVYKPGTKLLPFLEKESNS